MANSHCRKRSHDLTHDLDLALHRRHTDSPTKTPPPASHRQRLQHGLPARRLTTPVLPSQHSHPPPPKRRSRTLSHSPSMPVHIASVMSAPYPYPSFMSVYGSDGPQLDEIPDCECYERGKEQDRAAGQITSSVHSAPAHTLPAQPLAIHRRSSINSFASDSTTPSPSTSHSSPSISDSSPTSSPESACSNPCLGPFTHTMPPPPSHGPTNWSRQPPVYPGQHSPDHTGRNVKKLSLNMASVPIPRLGSISTADSVHAFSAPTSPLKEPLRSARKKPTNLTIRTPGFQQLAFSHSTVEVPPTPSSRPSLHTFSSTPSLPWLSTPTTSSSSRLHISVPSLGSSHSRPGSDSSVSSQCVSSLPGVREELDSHQWQEKQENGYPDGPVCIYDRGVYLYLEPTAAEARKFDTVINVAKEIKNPFDQPSTEHRTVMSTWRDRESRDRIPEPQTAISEASFKSAWETQPIESPAVGEQQHEYVQPEYVHVPWDHNSEIMDDLPALCRLIDDRTRRGKKVLIHCQLGVSRSASLTIAYGLWVGYQSDFHSMYMQVKQRSPWVGPNMGLIYQLTDFCARVNRGEYSHGHEQAAPESWFKRKEVPSEDASKTPTAKVPRPSIRLDKELPPVPLFEQEDNKARVMHVVTQMSANRPASPPRPLPFRTLAEYTDARPLMLRHKARRAPAPAGVAVDRAQASAHIDLASENAPPTPSIFSPRSTEFAVAPIGAAHSIGEITAAGSPEDTVSGVIAKSIRPAREEVVPSTVDLRSPPQPADSKEIIGSIDGLWITYPIIAFCTLRTSPPTSRQRSSIRLRGRDFTFVCFYLADDRTAREVYDSIRALTCKLGRIERLYAFSYQPQPAERDVVPNGWSLYDPVAEWARMGVGAGVSEGERNKSWRISRINTDYRLSPTYPALFAVPASISDNTLKYAAAYRSRARIPVLTYLHPVNNCSITRSSQPMVGVRGNRSIQDETLLAAIFSTTRDDLAETTEGQRLANAEGAVYGAQQRNMIVDARPTVNAYVMQAAGLGTENMDNYKFATKAYLGIDNIHVMRDSLQKVIDALKDSDLSPIGPSREALHKSHWLKHIANMLDGVGLIARQVALQHSHVLIHCSDGWDRTSQLSALSQICLDPYYRTMHGFIVLVEKDWLSFGHMFQHRSGFLSSDKWFQIENERIAGRSEQTDDPKAPTDAISGAQRKIENALLSAKGFFTKQNNDWPESITVDSDNEESECSTPGSRPRLVPVAGASGGKEDKTVTKVKETAPIFHQFLDATYQLMYQHPTRFEFSERFLRRLLYHLHSCQYGTFLLDNECQRKQARLPETTRSVWDYFLSRKHEFLNPNYDPVVDDKVRGKERLILPRTDEVRWWHELFGRTDEEMNGKPFDRSAARKPTIINGDHSQTAAGMSQEVLAKQQQLLGEDHPDTIDAMSSLASTLHAQGKLEEAARIQKEVLAKRQQLLGEDHPGTIDAMNKLASIHHDQGRQEEEPDDVHSHSQASSLNGLHGQNGHSLPVSRARTPVPTVVETKQTSVGLASLSPGEKTVTAGGSSSRSETCITHQTSKPADKLPESKDVEKPDTLGPDTLGPDTLGPRSEPVEAKSKETTVQEKEREKEATATTTLTQDNDDVNENNDKDLDPLGIGLVKDRVAARSDDRGAAREKRREQMKQHFELLPEPQLRAAQQSVAGEIAPAISQLLATADKYVDELARREAAAKARYVNSARVKLLRQKKERLQYAIDRLELQLKQRERELRKSMAFVRE
ncbi:hypothetical protein DV735_g3066, partial [Chaetothyriales sp. CBS 134920]